MPKKQVPDNVAPNPQSLPYASDLGAPVIKPNYSLGGWKVGAVHRANQHYQERFDKLKSEYQQLSKELEWNEVIFNAEMRFKPVIGKEYHLYIKNNSKYFLSLFAPNECSWGETNVGTFRLNYDNRWDIISINDKYQ
jgi:hypothetical protein